MPTKAPRPCSTPGCPARATVGSRCAEHAKARQVRYDAQRGNSSQRGYGSQWARERARFLAAHPVCSVCGKRAVHVDHVVPKRRGGTDAWSNLQPLCASCHSRKTAVEDGRWGR